MIPPMSESLQETPARGATGDGHETLATPPDVSAIPAASVVLPVYNEQGIIQQTLAAVEAFAGDHADYEFVFVDDGSTDDTAQMVRTCIDARSDDSIRLLTLGHNHGKGAAIKQGFDHTRGGLVIFTDGDLAYPLDYLPGMVEKLAAYDVVIGSRQITSADHPNNRRTLTRTVLGEGFNGLTRMIMGLPYRDTQAGIKGFRRDAAAQLFPRARVMHYCTDVELLFLARKRGLTVGQIPVRVDPSHAEKPTSMNLLGDPPRMLADMMRIHWNSVRGRYD